MSPPLLRDDLVARVRREVERNALRARNGIRYAAGREWSPVRPTPRDVVWRKGKAELWRYRNDAVRFSPPVLLFLGLVSRSYVFDLHPDNSLVAQLRDAGFDIYVLDWGVPDAGDSHNTFETYVHGYLPRAVRAALRESDEREVSLFGYCMGGNFSLLALATQEDLPVRNLVTLATPVDFSAIEGLSSALRDGSLDPNALVDWTGNVPPEYLSAFFRARRPTADVMPYANLWENLWNDEYVGAHQAMARWSREHIPFPGAAFRQMIESWFRANGFMTGRMRLGGRPVRLERVRLPMLSVMGKRDSFVPPDAARPIGSLVGSEDFELAELDAAHAGLTASRKAAKVTIPLIADWLARHSEPKEVGVGDEAVDAG